MSRPDVTLRFHLAGILTALAVIGCVVWEASRHGRTSFRMGRETMYITVTERADKSLAWYYRVESGKDVKVARRHFRDGGGWWPPRFQLIDGADPNVLAVVEREDPRELLILYDNSTGASWPADIDEVGEKLLARFSGRNTRAYHIAIGGRDPNALQSP